MYLTIRVWEAGDTVFGRMTIPLRGGGSIGILLSVTQKQVIEAIRRMGIKLPAQEIGSIFGSIGKFVKKVAKSSVVKGLLKAGKAITGPVLSAVVPGAALAINAASGAMKMINAAKKGTPAQKQKAKLALKAATAQADLETKQGKQLPVPSGVKAKGPAVSAAFRYLVTVKRAEA